MGELTVLDRSDVQSQPKMGRPTVYNHETGQAICNKIAGGMTKRGACGLFGVNEETFRLWQETRDEFIQMLMRAEAEAEERFTESMRRGAEGDEKFKGDWKAGESWLKRRRRAEYGDTLDLRQIPPEQLLRLYMAQQAAITEDGDPALAIESAEDVL